MGNKDSLAELDINFDTSSAVIKTDLSGFVVFRVAEKKRNISK